MPRAAEAYLARVHTEDGPSGTSAVTEKLLAYLDEHHDELRQEAARGGDDVRIPRHPDLLAR